MNLNDYTQSPCKKIDDKDLYTRGMLVYIPKLKRPVFVELITSEKTLEINMYDTDIRDATREEQRNIGEYLNRIYETGNSHCFGDIEILDYDKEPICSLRGQDTGMARSAAIQSLSVADDYVRNGLGTLALRLAEDVFAHKKLPFKPSIPAPFMLSDETTDEEQKEVSPVIDSMYVNRNYPTGLMYQTQLERDVELVGKVGAYIREKTHKEFVRKAYIGEFLGRANGFKGDPYNPYDQPSKQIKPTNMVAPQLLGFVGEENVDTTQDRPIQLFDRAVVCDGRIIDLEPPCMEE